VSTGTETTEHVADIVGDCLSLAELAAEGRAEELLRSIAHVLASKITMKGWAGADAEIRIATGGAVDIWLSAKSTLAFPRSYGSAYDFDSVRGASLADAVAQAERIITKMPEEPTVSMAPWFDGAQP
jgi:hypothetical protein